MSNKKLIKCKACGAEISKGAKACPSCGHANKKPIFLRWWFIALVLIVIIAIASSGGNNDGSGSVNTNSLTNNEQETEPTYIAYDVATLVADLEDNALKAENTYVDQYVEITGRLGVIDSEGSYITLYPTNNQFALIGVQCYIKNSEQKAQIIELSKNDTVTVCGKITSVGEILGYSLDIASIK